jgi:RimJ/RimL family protein N-acetyltransferase
MIAAASASVLKISSKYIMQKSLYDLIPHEIVVRDDLKLRLLVSDDASRIFEIFQADPDIQNRVTWTSGLKTFDDIQERIRKFSDNDELRYAIVGNNQVVGYIGAWKDKGWFGVTHPDDYGYGYFCDPTKRGSGIVTDAAKALMSNVESVVYVKTFSLYIEDSNPASQAVAKRLGFVRTDETYLEPILGSTERRYIREVAPAK